MDDKELVERLRQGSDRICEAVEQGVIAVADLNTSAALDRAASRITVLREALDEIANARWPSVDGDDPVKRIQARARQALSGEESE